jgi:hypothetical protein
METKIAPFESETSSFVPSNAIENRLEPPQPLGPEAIIEDASERAIISRSMDSIGDEPLAELVINGVHKFRKIIPAIIELRKRFSERPRGHAGIAGCATWTEFCTRKLDRSIRAVQLALALSNTPKEELKKEVDAQGPWVEKQAAKLKPGVTQLTDEEKAAKHEREERLDLDARLLRELREASNEESAALIKESVPVPDAMPVVAVPTEKEKQELQEYKLIAAKTMQALVIADELLPLLFHKSNAKQHSLILKFMKLRNIHLSAIPTLEKGVAL